MLFARLLPRLAHDFVVGFVANLEKKVQIYQTFSESLQVNIQSNMKVMNESSCACGLADCAVCEISSTFGT